MSYSIVISRLALEKAAQAVEWYEEMQLGLGLQFEQELSVCLDSILANPFAYSFISNFRRQAKINRFPYVVIYEIFGDVIHIANVFNTHQQPDKKNPA